MQKRTGYLTFRVTAESELLPFIMSSLDGISRTRAKAILAGGGVLVNRAVTRQFDCLLKPRDVVEISRQKPKHVFQNRNVRIVYEDSHIIVVEKAVGILSMATSTRSLCVKSVLDQYFLKSRQSCHAHVVHRLDRDTSGLLVYAKTLEAEQILEQNWRDIVTDRRYVALVSGTPTPLHGVLRSWLKDNSAYVTYSSPVDNGGKFAVTHYRTLKHGTKRSILELKLETGRKNQIRVHLQDIGTPVCGDIKYGNGDDPIGRLALHAYRLCFYHPITRELLRFETPIPKNFLAGLE